MRNVFFALFADPREADAAVQELDAIKSLPKVPDPRERNPGHAENPHVEVHRGRLDNESLPVGDKLISFAAKRTAKGIEYTVESRHGGWTFVLNGDGAPGSYYLNGKPVAASSQGVRMTGTRNRLLVAR